MARRAKENLPGDSLKYLFVYWKVCIFKCSYCKLYVAISNNNCNPQKIHQRKPAILLVGCRTSIFSQTVWPHWGVLTVGVKARCLIEVVSGAFGIFPLKIHTKWLLWNVDVHFDCAGSHKLLVAGGAYFCIFFLNFHTKWRLWSVDVHFHCAGLHKTMSPEVSPVVFPVNFHMAVSQNIKPRSTPWTHRPIHTPDPYQNAGDPDRSIRLDHRGPIHTRILTQPHIYIISYIYIYIYISYIYVLIYLWYIYI